MRLPNNIRDHWVIGADTIVTIDNAILGKPGDAG
jgi:predicted house-cleaning NTP pyrophosphatase (Maf/HAM1 superfamily)